VFASVKSTMRDDTGMREGLYAAIEKAGATRFRGTGKPLVFHELRHTFSTLAVQAFALSDVRAYIGPRGHPDHHALRAPRPAARRSRRGRPARREGERVPARYRTQRT